MKDISKQSKLWMDRNWSLDYINRNNSSRLLESNVSLFSKIFRRTDGIKNLMEIGANIGLNLDAINLLNNSIELECIEINSDACEILKNKEHIKNVFNTSVMDFELAQGISYDLVFTKTVLIHIHPDYLHLVYKKIYEMSARYVLFIEYYNPKPISLNYRGMDDYLFKADFAREFMDLYQNTKLIDYGFVYHGDNNFPQDDVTWFLIEIVKSQ